MNATDAETCPLPEQSPGEYGPGRAKAARLRAIHDLVRSNSYQVPARLVAERMVERAVADRQDLEG